MEDNYITKVVKWSSNRKARPFDISVRVSDKLCISLTIRDYIKSSKYCKDWKAYFDRLPRI